LSSYILFVLSSHRFGPSPADSLTEQIVDELDNRIEEARFDELVQLAQDSLVSEAQHLPTRTVEVTAPPAPTQVMDVDPEEDDQYAHLADDDLEEEELVHEGLSGGRDAETREIDEVAD
jgi:hypothetical protein